LAKGENNPVQLTCLFGTGNLITVRDRILNALGDVTNPVCIGTKNKKAQIGKKQDGEKIVWKMSIGKKIVLVNKIDKTQAWQYKKKAKGYHQTIIHLLLCQAQSFAGTLQHDPSPVPQRTAQTSCEDIRYHQASLSLVLS
jgi:hypothetical protein